MHTTRPFMRKELKGASRMWHGSAVSHGCPLGVPSGAGSAGAARAGVGDLLAGVEPHSVQGKSWPLGGATSFDSNLVFTTYRLHDLGQATSSRGSSSSLVGCGELN